MIDDIHDYADYFEDWTFAGDSEDIIRKMQIDVANTVFNQVCEDLSHPICLDYEPGKEPHLWISPLINSSHIIEYPLSEIQIHPDMAEYADESIDAAIAGLEALIAKLRAMRT